MASVFGDFLQLIIQRLNGVGRIYDSAQLWWIRQKRNEMLPRISPGLTAARYFSPSAQASKSSRDSAAISSVWGANLVGSEMVLLF